MDFAKGNKRSLVQSSLSAHLPKHCARSLELQQIAALEAAASPAAEGEDEEGLRKAMAASLAEAQIQDETISAASPVENTGVKLAQFMALLVETKVILSLPTTAGFAEPAKLPNVVLDERLMEELGNIDEGPNDETKAHSKRMLTMFFKLLQAGRQKRMNNTHHSDMLSNECSASK